MDIIERAAEYKTRMGPNSDNEQDDDAESINGSDQWEYPTVKSPSTVVVRNPRPTRQQPHSIPVTGERQTSSQQQSNSNFANGTS